MEGGLEGCRVSIGVGGGMRRIEEACVDVEGGERVSEIVYYIYGRGGTGLKS